MQNVNLTSFRSTSNGIDDDDKNVVVRDLAKALLQIKQMLEPRYMQVIQFLALVLGIDNYWKVNMELCK